MAYAGRVSFATAATPVLPPDALAELHGKYVEMLAMRLEDVTPGRGADEAAVQARMARLASRFPGALREVDELALEVIRERIARLEAALADASRVERWMVAIALFHSLTRSALAAKRWLAGRKTVAPTVTLAYVAELTAAGAAGAHALAWAEDLARIASPPRGRLTDLVYGRIAQALGTSEDEARALVFAARGAGPSEGGDAEG
ncbi:MAG TPA: hypothetical protein VHV30_12065 [Polyangiaceae bacterium]|jgi:hypothetical protein|nr:hypothetical protein [Polyangiaceae bacterium]